MAMGNSKGMVKRLSIRSTDAAKYLAMIRYVLND